MKLAANNSTSFLSEARQDDEIDFTDHSAPFLSGHGFSLRCHRWFSPNMKRLGVNPTRDNDLIYVKTDHLPDFFRSGMVPDSFVLVTHNSDYVIDDGYAKYYDDPRVRLWLAMNKGIKHPKIAAIADGLQNACYGVGSAKTYGAFIDALGIGHMMPHHYKSDLFYANFTIDSHFNERARCVAMGQPQGVTFHGRTSLIEYLAGIARSMFTMCPAGSGLDSCRPYEALYLKSVPVMRASPVAFDLRSVHGVPLVDLDDWTETHFTAANFSFGKWQSLIEWWDPREMYMEPYCARLEKRYGVKF